MYKKFIANDYRKLFNLSDDYTVDGFIVYGTYKSFPYKQLEDSLNKFAIDYVCTRFEHGFLGKISEIKANGKVYWFTTAYGGAILSEYLHLACLFGSKKNVLIGSCGGLKKGASTLDLVIPHWSYADESSAKAYQPNSSGRYKSDEDLSNRLAESLIKRHKVHREQTITYQAMLAETQEDVCNWSTQGYCGVEMEAATVFAVSGHFGVSAAAILMISDNLIEEETVLDEGFEAAKSLRRKVSQDIFDVVLTEVLEG
jgi:purine-nucleoside phosphorylase